MGVFEEFFGFEGRIDRLGLLWRSLVAWLGLTILALAAIAVGVVVARPANLPDAFDKVIEPVMVGLSLLALWSAFALASRRLRAMGVEPLHVTPPFAALWVVNLVLLNPLAEAEPLRFGGWELAWLIASATCGLMLLLWPSMTEREPPPAIGMVGAPPVAYLDWRAGGDAAA